MLEWTFLEQRALFFATRLNVNSRVVFFCAKTAISAYVSKID